MINPPLAELRAFVAVGELQSFAAAAKAMHLSQPALSRRISSLEESLDVRLFDRTTRNVELTSLGRRFLGEVRVLVEGIDRSIAGLRDAAELEAGDVAIGCVFSAVHNYLPHVVQAFRERYPGVLVRIIEEGADEVLTSVKRGEADFAVNYIGMQDEELEFSLLVKEPYVLACPSGHPLSRRRYVNWKEIAPYPQARVSHASRNRLFIDQALAELPPLPRPIIEVRHVSTLIGFVEAGLAVAVVPRLSLPLLSRSVVGVRLEQPAISRPLAIVRRRGRTLSPAAEAFSRMLAGASPLTAGPLTRTARRASA